MLGVAKKEEPVPLLWPKCDPIISRLSTPCNIFQGRQVMKAGYLLPSIEHTLNARRHKLVNLNPNFFSSVDLNPWQSLGTVPWAKLHMEHVHATKDPPDVHMPPMDIHALAQQRKLRSVPVRHLREKGWSRSASRNRLLGGLLWEEQIEQILELPDPPNRERYMELLTDLLQKQVPVGLQALTHALEFLEGSLVNAFVRLQGLGRKEALSYHHFDGGLAFLGLKLPVIAACEPRTIFEWLAGGKRCISQEAFVSLLEAENHDPMSSFSGKRTLGKVDVVEVVARYAALRARKKVRCGADRLPDPPDDKELREEESRLKRLFDSMKKDLTLCTVEKDEFISFWGAAAVDNATHWFALTLTHHDPYAKGCMSACSFANHTLSSNYSRQLQRTVGDANTIFPNGPRTNFATVSSVGGRYTSKNAVDDASIMTTWKATWKPQISRLATSASSMFPVETNSQLNRTQELVFVSGRRKMSFEAFKEIVPQICFDLCGLHFGLSEQDM